MLVSIFHKLSTISKRSYCLTEYLKVAHFRSITDSTVSGYLIGLFKIWSDSTVFYLINFFADTIFNYMIFLIIFSILNVKAFFSTMTIPLTIITFS